MSVMQHVWHQHAGMSMQLLHGHVTAVPNTSGRLQVLSGRGDRHSPVVKFWCWSSSRGWLWRHSVGS